MTSKTNTIYHLRTITPINRGVEIPEMAEKFSGEDTWLLQIIEKTAHLLKGKYPDGIFAFKIECHDCKSIMFYSGGFLVGEYRNVIAPMPNANHRLN